MSEDADIQALVHLIDDPDETIYQHVRDRLLHYGIKAVPHLEQAWGEKDFGLTFIQRIEQLTHDIQYAHTKHKLTQWQQSPNKDLIEGVIILTKHHYPTLEEYKIYTFIDKLKQDVKKQLSPRQSVIEQVKILNKVFFNDYNFRGDSQDFHSPLNSYIYPVIELRKGNPLSLGILYIALAQSLKMPIYGVNLPNNFILAYMHKTSKKRFSFWDQTSNKRDVLFYINPFTNGEILDEHDISTFLKRLNIPLYNDYFDPCSTQDIIRRMLTNLISAFQLLGNNRKVKELSSLKDIIGN